MRLKTFSAGASGVLAALALAGCGGDSGDVVVPATPTPATPAAYKIKINSTTDVAGTFGTVGAYQQINGTFTGEVDPKDAKNAIIQDLALAPVNANGKVEYTTDFILYMPKDMNKSNGVLRYDAPNRGGAVALDPYFASRGYVFLTAAWQGDVPAAAGKLTLTVPVARNADGTSITGPYRAELVTQTATTNSLPLPGGAFNGAMVPYAPASLDNTQAGYALSRRINESDAREYISATNWKFATCTASNPFPGTADGGSICLNGGFDPKYMYEVIYTAKDPKVMGLGFAATRDIVSFFHNSSADAAGIANPIAGKIKNTIASGVSQCGNFIKTLIHLGFNQDVAGKQVFDGVYAQIAARQTNLNARFPVPGGGGGVRLDHTAPGQEATRGLDPNYVDTLSLRSNGGILKRCTDSGTCPKLFVGFSGTEFWALQGSPMLTDPFGVTDLVQPANVRVYYYASSHHLIGLTNTSGINSLVGALYPINSNPGVATVTRALYQDLEQWVVAGTAPPDSQVPKISDKTLVLPQSVAFPAIPGVTYTGLHTTYSVLDFGPNYKAQDSSGIASLIPPAYAGRDYAIMVPQVDTDGNDIAGIRSVDVAAGLGTNTGWNYTNVPGRIDLAGSPLAPGLVGSYFAYPQTRAARVASGDPRPSLEERYGTQAGYVAAVTAAANDLVTRRFLLRVDADAAIAAATAKPILP